MPGQVWWRMTKRYRNFLQGILGTLALLVFSAASVTSSRGSAHMVKKDPFGKTRDGQTVDLYTLTNARGMEVRAMTYGGIIVSIKVPDRTGKLDDVTLGFDSLDAYLAGHPYFGPSSGGMAIGLARRGSRWTALSTNSLSTTAPTPCTGD